VRPCPWAGATVQAADGNEMMGGVVAWPGLARGFLSAPGDRDSDASFSFHALVALT